MLGYLPLDRKLTYDLWRSRVEYAAIEVKDSAAALLACDLRDVKAVDWLSAEMTSNVARVNSLLCQRPDHDS